MQRVSQAAKACHKPVQAGSSYLLRQGWLPRTPTAVQSVQESCCSLLQLNPMCSPMRSFSSQGIAASPPQEDVQEQQGTDSQQPLARIIPKDMMAMYTCNVCKTRSAKMFSKKTYETGVVIVRCPGCQGNHLIADRLGWFGEPGSVEDYLAQQGQEVMTRTLNATTQLSAEDLMGWSKARELAKELEKQ
ncbi:hypothetical protein ABBQ38_004518 [Trebouxia sp. C0009 RCD-2024]